MPEDLKILVVDDSMTMRKIQTKTLKSIGFENIEEATDGANALEKISAKNYDLILLDWVMPGVDGLSVLKKVRESDSHQGIPIIMVTSESEKSMVLEALQSGATNYITKPFDPEDLKKKIKLAVSPN